MKNIGLVVCCFFSFAISAQSQFEPLKLKWSYHREGDNRSLPASVPGTLYRDQIYHQQVPDPFLADQEHALDWMAECNWIYETEPFICTGPSKQVIRFNGLDTYADVYLNDSLILSCNNAFRIWDADVNFLPEGNVLRIFFHSPLKKGQEFLDRYPWPIPGDSLRAVTRKPQCHFGWDWGPRYITCGITGEVMVRPRNDFHIDSFIVSTDRANEQEAALWIRLELIAPRDTTLEIAVTSSANTPEFKQTFQVHAGRNVCTGAFICSAPPLWYCNGQGFPNLIDFTADVRIANQSVASKTIRSGIRSAKWITRPDSIGESFYLELNGHPVFVKGVNIIPVSLDPIPDAERLERYTQFVRKLRDANINMVRVWGGGKYEDDLFYELCDQMGIMVWQDFMFACSMYPGSSEFIENVSAEADDQLRRLSHHPAIVLWCGNNENAEGWSRWGWKDGLSPEQIEKVSLSDRQIFLEVLPWKVFQMARMDYWPSSPRWGRGDSRSMFEGDCHYWGVWHDEEPLEVLEKKIPRFMSEFGVQSYPSKAALDALKKSSNSETDLGYLQHQKHPRGFRLMKEYTQRWYLGTDTQDRNYPLLTQAMQAEGVVRAILAQRRAADRCMGTMFWQWNDVWPAFSWSAVDGLNQDKLLAQVLFEAYAPEVLMATPTENGLVIDWISDHHVDADSLWLECAFYAADDLPREPNPNASESAVPIFVATPRMVAIGTGVLQLASINYFSSTKRKLRSFEQEGVIEMKLRSRENHQVVYRRLQKLTPITARHIIPMLRYYNATSEKGGLSQRIPVVMYEALKD